MAYESAYRSIKIRSGKIGNLASTVTMGLPGTVAEYSFPFNSVSSTEQDSTYMKTYDLSETEYQDVASSSSGDGYTNDYQLFPDTEAVGDYLLIGAASPFGIIKIDVSATAATYSDDAITWQYWNGDQWASLSILWDDTNTTPAAGGKRPFMQDGQIIFSAPSDWHETTIDSQEAYWVRAYVDDAAITQIPLLDSHEHYLITDENAFEMPCDGEIVRGRFTFTTNSASNNDTEVILCNLSSGICSDIKTITKAQNKGAVVDDFGITVEDGDYLAFYVTVEDGTTEYADGMVELEILRK